MHYQSQVRILQLLEFRFVPLLLNLEQYQAIQEYARDLYRYIQLLLFQMQVVMHGHSLLDGLEVPQQIQLM